MIRSEGILADLLATIPQVMFLTGVEALKRGEKKGEKISKKCSTRLNWMKSVLTPLAKSVLLPFGIPTAMSAIDAAIQKKKKFMDQKLWH